MSARLAPAILKQLKELEPKLQATVATAESDRAIEYATTIQCLFDPDRRHHRLLRAKLWAFEACINDNRLTYAERGLIGVRNLANSDTRLHIEATALLAVCYLRQKEVHKAKPLITEVMQTINNIQSDRRRHQFQKRFIEQIEEECILAQLVGTLREPHDPKQLHEKAILLLQQKDKAEIVTLIGDLIPASAVLLLREVRDYSILQLPAPDRKLLPAAKAIEAPTQLGARATAVLKRIAWRAVCDPESTIYKAWSKKLPKVYNEAYFATALAAVFTSWKIGIPMLVSGIVAIVMKYSAHEFCHWAKPTGLMIAVSDKESA